MTTKFTRAKAHERKYCPYTSDHTFSEYFPLSFSSLHERSQCEVVPTVGCQSMREGQVSVTQLAPHNALFNCAVADQNHSATAHQKVYGTFASITDNSTYQNWKLPDSDSISEAFSSISKRCYAKCALSRNPHIQPALPVPSIHTMRQPEEFSFQRFHKIGYNVGHEPFNMPKCQASPLPSMLIGPTDTNVISAIIQPRSSRPDSCDERLNQPVVITCALLQALRDLPMSGAAQALCISVTSLKKACRRLGIRRWAYRRGPGRASRKASRPVDAPAEPGRPAGCNAAACAGSQPQSPSGDMTEDRVAAARLWDMEDPGAAADDATVLAMLALPWP